MTLSRPGIIVACLSWLITISLMVSPASAIILQDGNQPTDIPGVDMIGTVGSQASCVVIAPNFILTTRHQGFNNNVVINGVDYTVVDTLAHNSADFRFSRIVDSNGDSPNFDTWAELWTSAQGSEVGQEIVLGGFGRAAGSYLGNGYAWLPGTSVDQLRWGTNEIDATLSKASYSSGTTDVIELDFTRLSNGTTYEASVATYDSGGGWYIDQDDTWYVAGLTRAVEGTGATIFGDWADAVRVSSYADWIYNVIRISGDANWDFKVTLSDLTILATNYGTSSGATWYDGDFNNSGTVTLADLTMLATNYGFDGTDGSQTLLDIFYDGPAGGSGVPEPSTMVLLALAGPALLVKKRRKTTR